MEVVILIASSLTVITAIILLGDSGGSNNRKKTPRKHGKAINNTKSSTGRALHTRPIIKSRQLGGKDLLLQLDKSTKKMAKGIRRTK